MNKADPKKALIKAALLLFSVVVIIGCGGRELLDDMFPPQGVSPAEITVSGAQFSDANGLYTRSAIENEKYTWVRTSGSNNYKIVWCDVCDQWELQNVNSGCPGYYQNTGGVGVPDKTGWSGSGTVPTLYYD